MRSKQNREYEAKWLHKVLKKCGGKINHILQKVSFFTGIGKGASKTVLMAQTIFTNVTVHSGTIKIMVLKNRRLQTNIFKKAVKQAYSENVVVYSTTF